MIASSLVAQQAATGSHAQLAQKYLAERNPKAAIPELEAVVRETPNDVDAQANLGVLLFFQSRYADAEPHLQAAVALKPDLWRIRSLLGSAERRTGNDADGRLQLEAAFPNLNEKKLKIQIGQELIESYAASDNLEKAAEMVGQLLKLDPTNASLLYTSYRVHTDMAVASMLELGLAAPESGQTHQAIAHEMQRDHDLNGTIANLRAALRLDPNLPGIHFELAEALHASDDQRLRGEAEGEYRLAVSTTPGDAKAITRLGDIEVEKGDLSAGAELYQRALKLDADSSEAAIGLANTLTEQGKPDDALSLLLKVEDADPSNVLAHYRLSAVYRKLKRPDDVKREVAFYQRYKEDREKLKAVYQQMRVTAPGTDVEK